MTALEARLPVQTGRLARCSRRNPATVNLAMDETAECERVQGPKHPTHVERGD